MGDILSFRHRKILWSVPTLMPDLTIHDWLGCKCWECYGTGEAENEYFGRGACRYCGGTGEAYGFVCFAPCVKTEESKNAHTETTCRN